MLAKIQSCAVIGLEGALVEVEVDLSNGLAAFSEHLKREVKSEEIDDLQVE